MKITDINGLTAARQNGLKKLKPDIVRIAVGMGTCGIGNGAALLFAAFDKALKKSGLKAMLTKTGCFGFCSREPLVNISIPGMPLVILQKVSIKDVPAIISALKRGTVPEKLALCKVQQWDHLSAELSYGTGFENLPLWDEIPFFKWQKKIVLRNSGIINPEDIEEYIAVGGYDALFTAFSSLSPDKVIEEVKKAKLRGRGGAGFPTGRKWELMRQNKADRKYIICNADEGDPGAYMNRNEIESDPHMLIEGMIIGAYAMGACEGVVYIRAEYPLAVNRLKMAIDSARERGILGRDIFGSGFSFDLQVVEGAGAFVCGEETALISSVEGNAGRPRPRPPFPAQKGLWGKPTNINNVETWCNIPVIIAKGAEWFSRTGTANSPGTKVFSLVGKIKNTGLVELALGSPIQTIVYNIGEGTGTKKKVKAIQTGGPSGGCVPAKWFNTPVDYESLNALGAIMGSGGMVVMDDDNCMVDVARYFTEFTTSESCGKCTPCREGLNQALGILRSITEGTGTDNDMRALKELGEVIQDSALCGLGQTAPNPVLTTLKYFRNEYEEHIRSKKCDGGVCLKLFVSPCENSCPLHMNIAGFLTMAKEGRLLEAFDSIIRDNPFPASSGRICHFHCKMRCRREDIDEPVSQGEVHRYIADTVYKACKEKAVISRLIKEKLPKTGKIVSIIGAGPAGLNAAFYLSRLGHKVMVYEAAKEAGGILRYGIPEYRLPKSVLAKEIGFIRKMGAEFIFNKKVDLEEFLRINEKSDAVFVAVGAYKNIGLGIKGEELDGVIPGTLFLESLLSKGKVKIGKSIAIIGAGNVAIDAARSAWRLGAKVSVVYRRQKEDMPANRDEIKEAEREGINFVFLAAPDEIIADGFGRVKALRLTRMTAGDYDISGRRKPVATAEKYELPCDTVMLALGERVDAAFLEKAGVGLNKDGTVQVDAFSMRTCVNKIYAGGDMVSGPSTAVEAMAQGKTAAESIDKYLMGASRMKELERSFVYGKNIPLKPFKAAKQSGKMLDLGARRNNFKEVSLGLSAAQVNKEALRCLRCDVKTE